MRAPRGRWALAFGLLALGAFALWRYRPASWRPGTPGGVARQATCLSNLSRIGLAFALYAGDFDDRYPRGVDAEDRLGVGVWDDNYDGLYADDARSAPWLHHLLASYGAGGETWRCPSDRGWQERQFAGYVRTLPDTDSSWRSYGSSYSYLTLCGFAGLRPSDFAAPESVSILFDADYWHVSNGSKSVNTLFADGSAANLSPARFEEAGLEFARQRPRSRVNR